MRTIETPATATNNSTQEEQWHALIGGVGNKIIDTNKSLRSKNENEEEETGAPPPPATTSSTSDRNWTKINVLLFLQPVIQPQAGTRLSSSVILLVILSISVLCIYRKMDSSLQNYTQNIPTNQSFKKSSSTLSFPPHTENLIENLFPMCVGQHHVILPVANASMLNKTMCSLARVQVNCSDVAYSSAADNHDVLHGDELSFDPNKLPNYYHTRDQIVFWQDDVGSYATTNTWLTGSREQPPSFAKDWPSLATLPSTNETVLFLDSCMGAMQFGHALTQVIRLIILSEVGFHGDHLVNFYNSNYTRWQSSSIDSILDMLVTNAEQRRRQQRTTVVAAPSPSASVDDQKSYYIRPGDLDLATRTMTQCFQNPVRAMCKGERYYRTLEDVHAVQSFVRREYTWFAPTTQSCPPPTAAVLYRSGLALDCEKYWITMSLTKLYVPME